MRHRWAVRSAATVDEGVGEGERRMSAIQEPTRRGTGCLARALATPLAALASVAVTAALFLLAADLVLLSPDTYKAALREQRVYDRLPSMIGAQLDYLTEDRLREIFAGTPDPDEPPGDEPAQPGDEPSPAGVRLTGGDVELLLRALAPPDWLRRVTEHAIDQAFATLDSPERPIEIRISLVELKERLAGQAGIDAALRLVRSWPPCTAQQLAGLDEEGGGPSAAGLPRCRPPEETIARLMPEFERELGRFAASLDDEVDLGASLRSPEPGGGSNEPADSPDPRVLLAFARTVVRLSWLLPLVLLLLVTALAVRSRRTLLLWWGVPLFLAGFVALGVAVVGRLAGIGAVEQAFSGDAAAALEPEAVEVALGLATTVLLAYWRAVALGAVLVALVGVAMLLGARRLYLRETGRT